MIRVRVADGELEGLDTSGGRWQVICDTHGSIVSVDSRRVARADAAAARRVGHCGEWCEDCRDGVGVCDCGEREDGEHGHFSTDSDDDGVYRTYCNHCGSEVE